MTLEVLQRNLRSEELLGRTREQARELEETERFFRSVLELSSGRVDGHRRRREPISPGQRPLRTAVRPHAL